MVTSGSMACTTQQPQQQEQEGASENNNKKVEELADTAAAITLAKDSADILLAPEGNLMQQLLVTESAKAASAGVKDALFDAMVESPKRFRESLPLNLGSILPASPLEGAVAPFLQKTNDEEKAQTLVRKLSAFLPNGDQQQQQHTPTTTTTTSTTTTSNGAQQQDTPQFDPSQVNAEQLALVAKELRENIPKYAPLVGQLGGKFASTLLETASNNIERTLDEEKVDDDLVRTAAKQLSSVASQSAEAIKQQQQQQSSSSSSSSK
mmetsp:Transcript_2317/g.3375  ORF Transcript_2317/g.3375 Transcript_2317/m.3375 type:complete len:265 (-) Transcript_2317:99-893(-)